MNKTFVKRRTDTREAVRRLLHVQRGLIAEIGYLRQDIQAIRKSLHLPKKPGELA